MFKNYLCSFCSRRFTHFEMWASKREQHIEVRSTDHPETPHKYKYCCNECEAKFRIEEEEDLTIKAWWAETPEGWETLVSNVKADMAALKYQKHKSRGKAFKDAVAEVEAERIS